MTASSAFHFTADEGPLLRTAAATESIVRAHVVAMAGPKDRTDTGIATSAFPRRAVSACCAKALTARQFGSPCGGPPCLCLPACPNDNDDWIGCARHARRAATAAILDQPGRSSRRLILAGDTEACNAGLKCMSYLPTPRCLAARRRRGDRRPPRSALRRARSRPRSRDAPAAGQTRPVDGTARSGFAMIVSTTL